MDILFYIAIILFAGLLFSKIAQYFNLPNIIGYLIAGVIIGPSFLNLISYDYLKQLNTFSIIALSFIAFLIGTEFKLKYIKKLGIKPLIIALSSAFLTLILVTIGLYLFGCDLGFSLIMGAIASSTAPTATMAIIKQTKASGNLTKTILSVIAIDDIISIIIFGFCIVFIDNLSGESISLVTLTEPFIEIFLSIIIGVGLGLILGVFVKMFKNNDNITILIIAFVFLTIFITDYYNISSLLVCMIMGGIFINYFKHRTTDKVLESINNINPTILVIFFVISGASLNIWILPSIALICGVYIICRAFGKIVGAYIGAFIAKEEEKVKKYIGPTLLSQTGLSIGLAIIASNTLGGGEYNIETIIVATSFIFDMFGTITTKIMLKKAKEIK